MRVEAYVSTLFVCMGLWYNYIMPRHTATENSLTINDLSTLRSNQVDRIDNAIHEFDLETFLWATASHDKIDRLQEELDAIDKVIELLGIDGIR